jgi:hypothetical protein
MARERWFFAHSHQRRGPVPLSELVESVLAQTEPRATLVWRKGFADWTRAEDIPEVERRIAPFLLKKEEAEAARRAPPPAPVVVPTPAPRTPRPVKRTSPLLYGAVAAAVVVVVSGGAWALWPRSEPSPPPGQFVPLGGTTTENAPAIVIPPTVGGGTSTPAPGGASAVATAAPPVAPPTAAPVAVAPTPTPVPAGVGDREAELPRSEVKKLRQVAAWSGTTLELTVYNGTAWRVTEVYVRVQRFVGDDVVEGDRPILLLPPEGSVDAGVADLLSKVAPDRKKPGVNPLDTGKFSGQAGEPPEGFRCEIESARGYAPR